MKMTKHQDEFHVMEYVRQVRSEMNDLYLQDKQQYKEALKAAAADLLRKT